MTRLRTLLVALTFPLPALALSAQDHAPAPAAAPTARNDVPAPGRASAAPGFSF